MFVSAFMFILVGDYLVPFKLSHRVYQHEMKREKLVWFRLPFVFAWVRLHLPWACPRLSWPTPAAAPGFAPTKVYLRYA